MNMQAAKISSKKREDTLLSFHTSFNYYAPLRTLDTAGLSWIFYRWRRERIPNAK